VAIGINHHGFDLQSENVGHMSPKRFTVQLKQTFIGSAHPSGLTASQHNPCYCTIQNH
jgi:hypothetical protein